MLRRALLVYSETAPKLRADLAGVGAKELARTARLFHRFGEDYHERALEEAHIFPTLRKAGGPAAGLVDVLKAQHDRGREVTDYILSTTGNGTVAPANAEPLARALETFVLMYRNHAAREDTIVFPAWKNALRPPQLHEMGELFEEIEHRQFGKDGFDDAVRQIAEVEQALGLADLARFTAPPPPRG